ncbi:MAG: tetratricopeptide repeat protein [Oscillospiraceae bacterium]|nr:tetratricopeptide repeat protein [Oscillospiraceae bacterium]
MKNKFKRDVIIGYEDFGKVSVDAADVFYSFDLDITEKAILDFLTGKTKFKPDKDFSPFQTAPADAEKGIDSGSHLNKSLDYCCGNEPLMTPEYAYTVLNHTLYPHQEYPEISSLFADIMDNENKCIKMPAVKAARRIDSELSGRIVPLGISLFLAKAYRDAVYQLTDVHAAYNLGQLYYEDRYGMKNYKKAARFFSAAAKNGDWMSEEALGRCYYFGHGVPKDYRRAFPLLTKCIPLERSAEACYLLGNMYANGFYVEKDEDEAHLYYRTAYDISEDDDITPDVTGKVLLKLGDCCLNGTGTEQNPAEALRWYQRAEYTCITQKDIKAESNLEEMHLAIKGQQLARRKLMRKVSR